MTGGSRRSTANWKLLMAKKMLHRAERFEQRALTEEEKRAWREVQKWLKSVLAHRYKLGSGSYGLWVGAENALDREPEEVQVK